jgi:N-acetylmuramoyl-L-alanine amidase
MPRVIISSGHSQGNPGVIANGLKEYEVARSIAKYAIKYIRMNGLISLLIPPNLEIAQRIEWINNTGYQESTSDVIIEIHINDGGKRGVEAWYKGEGGNKSQEFTNIVAQAVSKETALPMQGVKSEFQHELGSISFLHEVNPISSLIEIGYIDNEDDAKFLKDEKNLEICGKGVAKGIMQFLGIEYREQPQVNFTQVTAPQPQSVMQPMQPVQPLGQPMAQPAAPMQMGYQQGQWQQPQPAAAYPPVSLTTPPPVNFQPQSTLAPGQSGQTAQNFMSQIAQPQPVPQPVQPAIQPMTSPVSSFGGTGSGASAFDDGFGGGGGFGSFGQPATGAYGQAPAGGNSREDRKRMIINNYIKILGREPNQNDLNYFLNINIREDELLKKMIESQEHVDLVKARQEVITLKKNYADQQQEFIRIKAEAEDQKNIISSLTASISEKNFALEKHERKLRRLEHEQVEAQGGKKDPKKTKKYKGTFKDKLFRAVSDIFE